MVAWIPAALAASSLLSPVVLQPGFSEKTISLVKSNLILSANKR